MTSPECWPRGGQSGRCDDACHRDVQACLHSSVRPYADVGIGHVGLPFSVVRKVRWWPAAGGRVHGGGVQRARPVRPSRRCDCSGVRNSARGLVAGRPGRLPPPSRRVRAAGFNLATTSPDRPFVVAPDRVTKTISGGRQTAEAADAESRPANTMPIRTSEVRGLAQTYRLAVRCGHLGRIPTPK